MKFTLPEQVYLQMDESDVLRQSRLPVELLATQITHQSILIIVMEHVRSQLCRLNEILPTDMTFVIFSTRVRFDMSIQCLLRSKSIAAHWTRVRPLSSVNSTMLGEST